MDNLFDYALTKEEEVRGKTDLVFVEHIEDVIDELCLVPWWEKLTVEFREFFFCHFAVRTIFDEFGVPEKSEGICTGLLDRK